MTTDERNPDDSVLQRMMSIVADLDMDVSSQDERIEKLERCVTTLIAFMWSSIDRINVLTHHVNVLRKITNHVDRMKEEIELLDARLADLKRVKGVDTVIHEAVICDQE